MNRKRIYFATFCLLLIIPSIVGVKAAKPIERMIETTHFEGTDIIIPLYVRGVSHVTLVVKNVQDDEFLDVTMTIFEHYLIYEYKGGELLSVLRSSMSYQGTIKGDMLPFTGKLVMSWVFTHNIADVQDPHGHWVIWYENGLIIRSIGYGQYFSGVPWPMP
ncbi:MAG: hypothetical protein ACFFDI_24280 [Promethearchaeota archaeon]